MAKENPGMGVKNGTLIEVYDKTHISARVTAYKVWLQPIMQNKTVSL